MKTELLREMSCRFLQNELGDPSFLFHLFEENTTLHDISNFKNLSLLNFQIFGLIHYYNLILGISQEACMCSISSLFDYFYFKAPLRPFTVTLFYYHKNNAYILLLVITFLKQWMSLVQGKAF